MRFYKVSKLFLNCLPIDEEIIMKLKDKDYYIGHGLAGDIAIYEKEDAKFNCVERINPSPELDQIFIFFDKAEVVML